MEEVLADMRAIKSAYADIGINNTETDVVDVNTAMDLHESFHQLTLES